ncbi:MAG: PTS galactitol transporter subunit IIB [Sulfobacillus benefaciens]|uniref:PTS galactitol transporter subunit IIB n=1 Tax=Sulfobacillus benefaciens TaxID=453960 RepID=A0A2T2XDG2_9FIRM|nr:MAG: PTS galactitol transporter subunit IIB [Sulfobacillus benefaciens]
MTKPFSILVVCGTGIATSTMVATKVKEYAETHGLTPIQVRQGKVMDLLKSSDADVIIATTQVPDSITIPVINAIPLLTGMGTQAVFDKIEDLFRQHQ